MNAFPIFLLTSLSSKMDVGVSLKPSIPLNTDNNIPEDILRLILVFLPGKTLLRFKCVCKHWYLLISSTDFIKQHLLLNKNKVNHPQLVRLSDEITRKRAFYLLSFNSVSQVFTSEKLSYPEIDLTVDHDIVGSCDGLICLNVYSNPSRRVIWNPATKQVKHLPDFPDTFFQRKRGFGTAGIGFGFDSQSNNYKVVWLSNYFYGANEENQYGSAVYVCSLGADRWREMDTPVPASFRNSVYDKAYTTTKGRGMSSWLCHGYGGSGQVVASYDMTADVVVTTPLPPVSIIGTLFERTRLLCSLNECVALLNAPESVSGGCCDVWILKDYGFQDSWTKLYTVGPLFEVTRMFGFLKNGDLVVENNHGKLISICSSTQERTVLPLPAGFERSFRTSNYVESLLPVG